MHGWMHWWMHGWIWVLRKGCAPCDWCRLSLGVIFCCAEYRSRCLIKRVPLLIGGNKVCKGWLCFSVMKLEATCLCMCFFFNSHVTHNLNHHALAEKLINSPKQCIDNLLNSNLCSASPVFGSDGAAFVLIQWFHDCPHGYYRLK